MTDNRLNAGQGALVTAPQPFVALVTGYGGGKTWGGCVKQCIHFLEHPWVTQGYFAPTYAQIRDIYFQTIEEVAAAYGFSVVILSSEKKEVHFWRGGLYYGKVICRSMDDPGSIVGFKIGRALVDEIDTMPMVKATAAWLRILARLRWVEDGVQNGADVVTTPEGFKFTYATFKKAVLDDPALRKNYALINASTRGNSKYLPPNYIDRLMEAYPEALRRAYIDGEFVNLTQGTVYKSYNKALHSSPEQVEGDEPLTIGLDFNVTKMAARIFVPRAAGQWHCVDERDKIYDTPAMIESIESQYPDNEKIVYPDATGARRDTRGGPADSDIALLENAGWHVEVGESNPRVRDRIMAVNKRFEQGLLFVSPRCTRTSDDLMHQAYDAKGEPDKKGGNDHGNDAFGYPIAYEFPIEKPIHHYGASHSL